MPIQPISFLNKEIKSLKYNNDIYLDYAIDKQGNILNLKTGNELQKSIHKSGYYVSYLSMGKRGKVKCIRNHKALADTYIENPNKLPVVHHIDENKLHCSLDNLEHVDHKLNKYYHMQKEKEDNIYFNNRKLRKEDIDEIKILKSFMSYREIAQKFNVSKTTIINICKGYLYKNDL